MHDFSSKIRAEESAARAKKDDSLMSEAEFAASIRSRFDALYDQMAGAHLWHNDAMRQAATCLRTEMERALVAIRNNRWDGSDV